MHEDAPFPRLICQLQGSFEIGLPMEEENVYIYMLRNCILLHELAMVIRYDGNGYLFAKFEGWKTLVRACTTAEGISKSTLKRIA